MSKIEIYYKGYCPYCRKAKALLDSKGVEYTLYDVTDDAEKQAEMTKRTGGARTVPQIFVDDVNLGGCDDIHRLDKQGKLNAMIGL